VVGRARFALVLAALVAGCGGGAKKQDDTTVSNQQGTVVTSTPSEGSGELPKGARVISRTQAGGVIELEGDRATAMQRADSEMTAHCGPDKFVITQEGEEAVGTDGTGALTATAWRVYYQCAQ
jgi:hypothetical protein